MQFAEQYHHVNLYDALLNGSWSSLAMVLLLGLIAQFVLVAVQINTMNNSERIMIWIMDENRIQFKMWIVYSERAVA